MKSHPFNDMFKDFAESTKRLQDPLLDNCPEDKKRQDKKCTAIGKWCKDRCPFEGKIMSKESKTARKRLYPTVEEQVNLDRELKKHGIDKYTGKPKNVIVEQINTPQTGTISKTEIFNYDQCVGCKANIRRQLIEEIDPHITAAIFLLHNDKDFESEMDWWQQFKGGDV